MQISAYNTGGWVTDIYEADELVKNRPLIAGILDNGSVQMIEVPWPQKSEFEELEDTIKDKEQLKKKVKQLIWEKL